MRNYLDNNPVKLGGAAIICQIDESLFCHKTKYNVGRRSNNQAWVFGIFDCSYTPSKGYMEIVNDRSASTLLPIIRNVCKIGTIIHSDSWKAYNSIKSNHGFEHHCVNHSINFVDPISGVHTQNIESYWNRMKGKIKNMKGLSQPQLSIILSEFVWVDQYRERAFVVLIGLLKCS